MTFLESYFFIKSGCCDLIYLHTDVQEIVHKGLVYPNTWKKKMIDTYTKRPVYEIQSIENERYFLYWVKIVDSHIKNSKSAWIVGKIIISK